MDPKERYTCRWSLPKSSFYCAAAFICSAVAFERQFASVARYESVPFARSFRSVGSFGPGLITLMRLVIRKLG